MFYRLCGGSPKHFGDRVKHFITFNEPSVFVGLGYKEGIHAPGLKLDTRDILTIGHHVHLAHGKAVRKIRELVKDTKIGITLATSPVLPENDSKEAVESARTELTLAAIFSGRSWTTLNGRKALTRVSE